MDRDLFFEILEENNEINEYDLENIAIVVEDAFEKGLIDDYDIDSKELYQKIIDGMQYHQYDFFTFKKLQEFIDEDII